jgi:hypothetical protein
MKKIISLIVLAGVLQSCSLSVPVAATSNKIGDKKGEACAKSILFIPISTDASIYSAAKNGGVKSISTVDHEAFFSGVYNTSCTVVRGYGK